MSARRIVMLADSVGGGTGSIMGAVVARWAPAAWDVTIMTPGVLRARIPEQVAVEQLATLRGIRSYPIGQLRRLIEIGRRLQALQADVLHTYFFWSILYGRVLRRLGVVPLLVENREDEGFNWGRHEYRLLRATAGIPERIICVSDAVRRVVLERERTPPQRVVTIHNGIELARPGTRPSAGGASLREMWGVGEGELVVGMVANFDRPVKGVPYFIEAMPLILERAPATRFVIIGRGDEEARLRANVANLGIESRVIFAGFHHDIDPCYEAMDVSVLTSLSEGLSMTVLESMRHGLPVVVTAVGGNPEIVRHGETGYLVPPRDVPAFAERVVELLLNAELRRRMGEAGSRAVAAGFDIGLTAARYLTLYKELFATSGAALSAQRSGSATPRAFS